MLAIPTLDIGVTSRAFLQDHRRKSYLQPINWSVLSSGDTPYVEPMETDDNGGAPEPDPTTPVHSTPIGPRPTTQSRRQAKQPKHLTRRQRRRNVFGHDENDLRAMRQLQLVIPRFQNRGQIAL